MRNLIILLLTVCFFACSSHQEIKVTKSPIDTTAYDTTIDGKNISLFKLQNDSGICVYITNYGARIVAVLTPDKEGNMSDIALGLGSIKEYLNDKMYLGPTVGRFANRIGDAKFSLDGQEYNLIKNDGDNTLHGGKAGLDKKIWDAVQDGNTLTLTYFSPDGEEGYPGNLKIKQIITLTENDEINIEFEAETDKPTVVNLTNHTYFNLKGEGDTTILDHYVLIAADAFTPVSNEWIPSGEIKSVENTPFDFRQGKLVGKDINVDDEQLKNGQGYDHNWVVKNNTPGELSMVAKVWEKSTGRFIEYYSTDPGVQFYCGNFMNSSVTGKSGRLYAYRAGLIFEPQKFPDSPNHENFPSALIKPGEKYTHTMIMKFGAIK